MTISGLGIVGGGQMGQGIAQLAAGAGLEVRVVEANKELLQRALEGVAKNLDKLVQRGRLPQEKKAEILKRVKGSQGLEELAGTEIIIEAVSEVEPLKLEIFRRLDSVVSASGGQTILASNTSSIPITRLASATRRPEKVIGIHFMNPAPVMELVEIVCGLKTSPETFQKAQELAKSLGKTVVEVKDYPGFIVNRLLMPMLNEAMYVLMEGTATREAIDKAMTLGTHQPMGPLALADFIGLDTCLSILETLHKEFGDARYRPCPLLRRYVEAGWLGKKSGKGFYTY
ncbi:MAG TPA: 3-hydroxyacyl-CoA dehydrogenase family protein [Candidatus Tripitaka californicus]|uniref:3-hydroxyacyl-CoA dehydrogenase family protein n=1 Tax=Candidatus Tripitaka californicus TaxID=3367616 RepID=UPI0040263A73|nr:3-hydroxybutyryl-CoA dehydrogenase [Planctomycetota bacterium]